MKTKAEQLIERNRNDIARQAKMLDVSLEILKLLPDDILDTAAIASDWIQFSSPAREQVERILTILRAGHWTKKVSTGRNTALDYEGVVDGVRIIIYEAQPPASCQIIERRVVVPEHEEVRRELVCH